MELWLSWAGSQGELEQKFLEEGRIYLTWDSLNADLSKIGSRNSLIELLEELFSVYDKLDDEIKVQLPLKRVWTVAANE